jgi:hypothetical protein
MTARIEHVQETVPGTYVHKSARWTTVVINFPPQTDQKSGDPDILGFVHCFSTGNVVCIGKKEGSHAHFEYML